MSQDGHVREQLGALALSALSPDEAAAVERHLEHCTPCRAEYERFAVVVPLLALVPEPPPGPSRVDTAPRHLEAAVLGGYRDGGPSRPPVHFGRGSGARWWGWRGRTPRPRVRRLRTALAGVASASVVLAAVGTLRDPPVGEQVLALRGEAGAATAELVPMPGGTRVTLRAEALPASRGDEHYEVWLVRDGGRVSAGTFTVGHDGRADVELTAAATTRGYARLGVTREPDGVDPARNGPSVLSAALEA